MAKRGPQLPGEERAADNPRGRNTRQRPTTPIGEWLREECQVRGIPWAEASRLAGVDKSTVSLIMRGQRPGLETCRALAQAFQVPTEHVLRLVGHLEATNTEVILSPAVREIAVALQALAPAVREPLIAAWRQTLDAVAAASTPEESA